MSEHHTPTPAIYNGSVKLDWDENEQVPLQCFMYE